MCQLLNIYCNLWLKILPLSGGKQEKNVRQNLYSAWLIYNMNSLSTTHRLIQHDQDNLSGY